MMTAIKLEFEPKTLSSNKSYPRQIEKEISSVNFKFYQKLLVVFISMSTFLIFPESPRELENICNSYNSKILCNVW